MHPSYLPFSVSELAENMVFMWLQRDNCKSLIIRQIFLFLQFRTNPKNPNIM